MALLVVDWKIMIIVVRMKKTFPKRIVILHDTFNQALERKGGGVHIFTNFLIFQT
jgi:hypothetical protein